MKIKYILPVCFILSLLSCKKETPEITSQMERSIKRKLFFNSPEEISPRYILYYEYDLNKHLVRTHVSNDRIDSFKYNAINQVVEKLGYEKDYKGDPVFLDSIVYQYQEGLLIKELNYDPYYNYLRNYIRYEYSNLKLIGKFKYENQKFVSYTRYEYSGDECTKETCYTDSLGSNISTYQDHHYKNKKLIGTETFGFNGSEIQIIRYTYDVAGNLIDEEAKLASPNAVNPYFYIYRYEYD